MPGPVPPLSPLSGSIPPALPPPRGLPLVVYVHRGLIFAAAVVRCDVLSLGYMALFLFSSMLLSTDRYWCYGQTVAEQLMVRRRSGVAFFGVSAWMGGYVVTAVLWSIGSLIGHIAMDTLAHSGKEKVLDPVLFVMLVSVLVDILILISAVGILKEARAAASTVLAGDDPRRAGSSGLSPLNQFGIMHFLAIVVAALSPSISTIPYFLFFLSNLWALATGPIKSRLRALRGRGRVLGAFAALHVLVVYFFRVFGDAIEMDCVTSRLFGLLKSADFELSTWGDDVAMLLLFLTSFAVEIDGEGAAGAEGSASAGGGGEVSTQGEAGGVSSRRAEMKEPLIGASDGDAGLGGASREAGATGGAGAQGGEEGAGLRRAGGTLWQKWVEAGWVVLAQVCGGVLTTWAVVFPGVLGVVLLVGGLVLVAAPLQVLRGRLVGALLGYTAVLLAAQFGVQVVLSPRAGCGPGEDAGESVLSLLGLVRFEQDCGMAGGRRWPACAGLQTAATQQAAVHLMAMVLQLRPRAGSAGGEEREAVGLAGLAGGGGWEVAVRRWRAWLRVLTVGLMLSTGLWAADGVHCGYLVTAVALSVSVRVSRRLWPVAMVGVAAAAVLTYLWHFDRLLPASAVWGLGMKRDLPLWSWPVLGAHIVNFLLLVLAYVPGRAAAAAGATNRNLEGASSRSLPAVGSGGEVAGTEPRAADRSAEGEGRRSWEGGAGGEDDETGVREEEVEGGWIGLETVQEHVGRAWKEGEKQAWRAWKSVGYVVVIGAMLLHGLMLTSTGEWLLFGLPTHPTAVNLFYLWAMLVLVLLHSVCGWEDSGLLRALSVWYLLVPTASLLLAARYIAQFEGASGWLLKSLGKGAMADLGVAKAANGDLFLDLVGDAVLVGLMSGQPSRLRMAARLAGRTRLEQAWKRLWRMAGCLPLQLALCQAGYQDHSVLGMGYVVQLVFALLLPARAGRMWGLPHLYAHASILCKFAVQFNVVQGWLAPRLPHCPDGEEGCFLNWLGLRLEDQQAPASLLSLLGSDLVVLLATCVVKPLDLSPGALARAAAEEQEGEGEEAWGLGWVQRSMGEWVDGRTMRQLTYHVALGALLVGSHLADTVMCLLLLGVFVAVVVSNNGTLRVWSSVNLLLGLLLIAWKAMQLLNKNPDWTSAPQVELRASCVYRWLGLLPQSAMEDERNTIAFVLPMICISLHIRALLQAPSGVSAEQSILVLSPRIDPDFAFADNADPAPGRRRSGAREVAMQDTGGESAVRPAAEAASPPQLQWGGEGAAAGGAGTAGEEVEAGAWKLWAMTQTAIFVGVLSLFYLFASADQTLATAMILLTILHAMYEQACIRALCLRLNLLLLLLLAVDAVFQMPVPLLYTNNEVRNGSVPVINPSGKGAGGSMWQQVCLGNQTRVARFAEAAGVDVGLGNVALRPIVALLVVMALRQLLLSTWYQQLELLVADESTRTERKGRAWVAAERARRAANIVAGEAELQQSRNRVRQLRDLLGGGGGASAAAAKAEKSRQTNMRSYFRQLEGVAGQRSTAVADGAAEEREGEEGVAGAGQGRWVGYLAAGARGVLGWALQAAAGSLRKSGLATRREAEHASRLQLGRGRSAVLEALWEAQREGTGHSLRGGEEARQGGGQPRSEGVEGEGRREEGGSDGEGESEREGGGEKETLWELVLGLGEALAATFSLNTHLVSYAAVVIWHCSGSLPASGLLVVFILSVAAFQDPFPARWHWTVAMGYLVLLAACKILARLLQERLCQGGPPGADDGPWVCESLLPWWFGFAGTPGEGEGHGGEQGEGGVGDFAVGDFAVLLVLAAHRANLQHRGLWRDVGILDLAPRKESGGGAGGAGKGGQKRRSQEGEAGEGGGREAGGEETAVEEAEAGEGAGTVARGGGAEEGGERTRGAEAGEKDWVAEMRDLFWLPTTSHGEFGTGVDMYMLEVTPELLSLLLFFVGIVGSGAGASDKLENLAQGGAVDWTTLGWVMLAFLQWLNIVIDRILYLRRLIWAKALMQIATVLFFFGLFFLNMKEPLLVEPSPSFYRLLYLLKCSYWISSAVQIRRGYPAVTRENYFFKDFSNNSSYLYIVYSVVPFLMDMRGMLDWTCTPTTLDFYQWMKLEAIYAMLHQRQVVLQYRQRLGRQFGQAQLYLMKFCTGLLYFVGLAMVIWAPLLISVVSSKYSSPQMIPVLGVEVAVSLSTGSGDYFQLTTLTAASQAPLSPPSTCPASAFANATSWLPRDLQPVAVEALKMECEVKDSFTAIQLTSEGTTWGSTPGRRKQLQDLVQGNTTSIHLLLQTTYIRNISGIPQASATGQKEYQERVVGVSKSVPLDPTPRKALAAVLAGGKGKVTLEGVVDPVVQLTAESATPLAASLDAAPEWRQGVELELQREGPGAGSGGEAWWEVCCKPGTPYCQRAAAGGGGGCGALWVLASVDPGSVNVLSRLGLSLITIYTIFVLAIGRSVRSVCTGDVPLTMYNEIPAIDKLWALCGDIYTARHHGDLDLEEELFTFLVDIYRSPETLLQLTGMGSDAPQAGGGGGVPTPQGEV